MGSPSFELSTPDQVLPKDPQWQIHITMLLLEMLATTLPWLLQSQVFIRFPKITSKGDFRHIFHGVLRILDCKITTLDSLYLFKIAYN